MNILGLNDSNSAACLIVNGEIIASAREERFDRIKFSNSYPTHAVNYCLKEAGLVIKQIDHIVFAWNPGHDLEPHDSAAAIRQHKNFLHYIPNNLLRHIGGTKQNKKITNIDQIFGFSDTDMKVHFVPHHHCHASSAFFVSPYEKAAILTIDAYGDDITSQFFIGRDNKIQPIGQTIFPQSMGQVYAAITQFLGYQPNRDEWKVMGLSAYGNLDFYEKFEKIINFDKKYGILKFDLDYFTYYFWSPRRYSDKFINTFGPERYHGEEITHFHMNIAASFQKRVEDVVLEMCEYLYERTELETICLAGGVAMNSKMNGRILRETPFSKVWIPPSADDAGCSLGACYYYWHQILKKKRCYIMSHDYHGPGYTNEEIKKELDDSLLTYRFLKTPEKIAAQSISKNKVIAWFQGRLELGQRALGNRSILADARDPNMKNKINSLIKHREWYRPFAPSVLIEYQKEYFDTDFPSLFMQMVYTIKNNMREKIPAVTHKDGTGRLQTVTKNSNPIFWRLINEFRKITGIPLILNTSFNDNNEPIVCTPKDAIRTFYGSGIQELYIGHYLIIK